MDGILTAFANSPDRGRGLARDFRVRWTIEELGRICDVKLVGVTDLKKPGHRSLHPFGQIPTWQEHGLELFESGAIVLHLAQQYEGLLPEETSARARAIAWVFASTDTIEPPIWDWDLARMVESHQPWHSMRQPMLEARIQQRLGQLAVWLGARDWLEGSFTLGDLMMVTVLRRLHGSGLLEEHPSLAAFVARGEDRPAFRRALAAQKADFETSSAATFGTGEPA